MAMSQIRQAARKVLRGEVKQGRVPEKWDGKATERIVEAILNVEF